MLWALFPIFAQLFYTSGGYIQNYLTDAALPKKRGGALILTHIPYFVVTILILFVIYDQAIFILPLHNALGLILSGIVRVFGSIYYYKALQEGDTADVNIFGQLSPLVALGLGVTILGETVTTKQGIGLFLIMAAALIVVFGSANKRQRKNPDLKVILLTLASVFFLILSDILYVYFMGDYVVNPSMFGRGLFYYEIGQLLTAIVILMCVPSWRRAIKSAFLTSKKRGRNIVAAIGDNVSLMLGELIYKNGLLIVPVVAIMTAIGKVMNLFVTLIFTIILGRIAPSFIRSRKLTKRLLMRYLFAAVLIFVGIMVMY